MTTTYERLRAILLKSYPIEPDALTADAALESLGIDSLGVAELMFNLEDEFKVRLSPEPGHLATVADVVAYIDGLVAEQGAGARPTPPLTRVQPTS